MQNLFDIILGYMVGGYFIALGLGVKGMIPDKLRGNKMLLIVGIAVCAANFALTMFEGKIQPKKITPQEMVASIRTRMNLPVQMDPMMRLETVAADDGHVIYSFSIAAETVEAYNGKIAEVRKFMAANGCGMKDSQLLLRSGIGLKMNYAAPVRLGLPESRIVIAPRDCGFMTPEDAAAKDDLPR